MGVSIHSVFKFSRLYLILSLLLPLSLTELSNFVLGTIRTSTLSLSVNSRSIRTRIKRKNVRRFQSHKIQGKKPQTSHLAMRGVILG